MECQAETNDLLETRISDAMEKLDGKVKMDKAASAISDYRKMTLYSFWTIYQDEIAFTRQLNPNQVDAIDKTVQKVTDALAGESRASISDVTFDDIYAAVDKAFDIRSKKDERKSKSRLKHLKELQIITSFAEEIRACPYDCLENFIEMVRLPRNYASELKSHFQVNHLPMDFMIAFIDIVKNRMKEDSGYFGLALMLLCGMSVNEVCALTIGDIRKNSICPEMSSFFIAREARPVVDDSNTSSAKFTTDLLMRNSNSYRAITKARHF